MSAAKILIVDDEPDIIEFLTYNLEREGYDIVSAPDGRQGLEAAQREKPDLIILDIMMPEMDGFEVIRRVKANPGWKDIPIVVVTAKDLTDSECGFLNQSVDRIIQKAGLAGESLMKEVQGLLREHTVSKKEDLIHEKNPGSGGC